MFPQPDGPAIIKRYDRLVGKRAPWMGVWQELADYLLPNRSAVVNMKTPGTKTTAQLFKSTAVHAAELLASTIHSSLTSPSIQWFSLVPRDQSLLDDVEVREWLEDSAKRMLQALNQSNFNSEVQETYLDLVVFGTGCLHEDERPPERPGKFGGVRFRSFAVGQYVIDEDYEGRVNEVHYLVEVPAMALVQEFGEEAVSAKTLKLAETRPEAPVKVVHAVIPRPNKAKWKLGVGAMDMPWASFIVEYETRHVIREGGVNEFPFHVPRWRKAAGETYGRGPGHTALPDIRTLNRSQELFLQQWALVNSPPLQVLDDGNLVNVRLTPGALNPVSQLDAIKPIATGASIDTTWAGQDRMVEDIRHVFFYDQIIVQQGGPQRTAEEMRIRYELMQKLLGPTVGRLESELLSSVIERTFSIMYRAKALAPPPMALVQAASASGGHVDIRYEGPMSRAQRSGDANVVDELYSFLIGVAQIAPEIVDVVDHEAALRLRCEVRGVSAKVLRDPRVLEALRMEKMAAAKQAVDAERGVQESAAAKNLAQAAQAVRSAPAGDMGPQGVVAGEGTIA